MTHTIMPGIPRELPTVDDHVMRAERNVVELWKTQTATFHYVEGSRIDNIRLLREVRADISVLLSANRAMMQALQSIAATDNHDKMREIARSTIGLKD